MSKGGLYTGPKAKKRRICDDPGGKVPKQNHKRKQSGLTAEQWGTGNAITAGFPHEDFRSYARRFSFSLITTTPAAFRGNASLGGFLAADRQMGW
jgi:hypothetical protein